MIPVQNVYYMLSYAFSVLNEKGYKKIETENFENTGELMAAILAKGIAHEVKRGLGRAYIPKEEELNSLRGKVNISQSIKSLSYLNKKLYCGYDDFSIDTPMNQIIKSTVYLLLKTDISKSRKKELRKLMVYFSDVSMVDLSFVNWKIHYNRNNQSYQMLISICYLVYKGLLQTNNDGTMKLIDFLDQQRMSRLYEKFILEYYKKHFPDLKVTSSQIPWALDDDYDFMLPIMQSDIHIEDGNSVLIIDAKYYSANTQTFFNKHTIHSNNLYQIFTYVKNKEYSLENSREKVSGMLLYAKTDEEIQPDSTYLMHGNKISVKTLDLNLPFKKISEQLDKIIFDYFS